MASPQREILPRPILITGPDGSSRTFVLERERTVLGRSSACELCFAEDVGLSRQHLAFEFGSEGWKISDLGSKNGTVVNGERISAPHILSSGDRISAGHLMIEFGGAPPPPANTVVFVEAGESTASGSSTVITSLSGILGSKPGESRASRIDADPRVRALIQAGRELAGHMGLDELFHLIMDLSVHAVGAERGVLMTLEGDELVVRAVRGEGFRISRGVRDRVINERQSLLVRDAQTDIAFRDRMSIVQQQVHSILAVPLQTDSRVIGLIYVDSPNLIHEFDAEDLSLLTVMANVAAIRIEHTRLAEVEATERIMARDMSQAAEIQRRLLPTAAPQVPGLDLAGYNAPCRTIGGDYYDFLPYPDGRVGLIVADVAGKGMPAALMMSSLQARCQVIFDEPDHLADRVTRLNRAICANCPENRFITLFACVVDPANGRITYCNAGHNPPLIVSATGQAKTLDGGGIVLGILPSAQYKEGVADFQAGDVLVLFSDGVTEACPPSSDDEFGEQRLAKAVASAGAQPASEIAENTIAQLHAWMQGGPAADDITLVVARRL
jgi:sigma-B regulation protein RsbU (phosphoserine phosphatase)